MQQSDAVFWIVTLLPVIGIGTILAEVTRAVIARVTGRIARQQSAYAQRDTEARARRALEEALHETRRVALDAGVPREALPSWPTYNTTTASLEKE